MWGKCKMHKTKEIVSVLSVLQKAEKILNEEMSFFFLYSKKLYLELVGQRVLMNQTSTRQIIYTCQKISRKTKCIGQILIKIFDSFT